MRSYTLIRKLEGHQSSVVSCDFSPDSALLVTASYDACVIMWDPYTGEQLRTLRYRSQRGLSNAREVVRAGCGFPSWMGTATISLHCGMSHGDTVGQDRAMPGRLLGLDVAFLSRWAQPSPLLCFWRRYGVWLAKFGSSASLSWGRGWWQLRADTEMLFPPTATSRCTLC